MFSPEFMHFAEIGYSRKPDFMLAMLAHVQTSLTIKTLLLDWKKKIHTACVLLGA